MMYSSKTLANGHTITITYHTAYASSVVKYIIIDIDIDID